MKHNVEAFKKYYVNATKEEVIEDMYKDMCYLQERLDKAIDKLDNFITCCKCEKLESGSDYLHNQYWNMFESFNKQVKEILKGGLNEK